MPAPRTNAPPPYQSQLPRKPSGFTPAVRVSSRPPRGRVFGEEQQPQEEYQEEPEAEITQPPRQSFRPTQTQNGEGPLTKSGYPDRRFKGQRDLPPPEPEQDQMQRARTGGMIGNMHVTIEGKPDRRFKENRGLSDDEVMARWADEVQARFGRKR